MKEIKIDRYTITYDTSNTNIVRIIENTDGVETDITDHIHADVDVSNFISSIINTIIRCDDILKEDKKYINEIWNSIDCLREELKSLKERN